MPPFRYIGALTTSIDNITTSGAASKVIGSVTFDSSEAATSATTYNIADTITGNSITDTLELTVAGAQDAAVTIAAANVTGVEVITLRNTVAQTANIAATSYVGLTSFSTVNSIGAVDVADMATGSTVGIVGNGVLANGNLNFNYKTGTAPVTLAISGGTTQGTITNDGTISTTATINVTGTVANNLTSIDLDSAQDITALTINASAGLTVALANDYASTSVLTVSGTAATPYTGSTAAVTLGTLANFKTINAAGLTAGGVSITGGSNLTAFTGGLGTDVFAAAASYGSSAAGIIDGNTGTDQLLTSNSSLVDASSKTAVYKNFEVLATADGGTAASSYNMALLTGVGITSLKLGAHDNAGDDQTFSNMTAAQAAAITVAGSNTLNDMTFSLENSGGTTDSATLNLQSDTATSDVDVSLLTINGFESLTINAVTGASSTSSDVAFKSSGADVLTSVTLGGTANVGFDGTNTTKAITVNGGTLTAKAKIAGNFVNASSITTGSGNDTITLGTGFATYNSGTGTDTFNAASVGELNTGANYNTLVGGDGVDTLNITGAQAITMIDDNFKNISGIEKLVQADTTTNNLSVTTGGWFDASFKTAGIDYTATTGVADSSITMSSFTGNATISLTTAAATTKTVAVATGSGADTVTIAAADFVGATAKLVTVSTGSGADTITVNPAAATALAIANAVTITAGGGADTIIVGTHVNGSSAGTAGFMQFVNSATSSPITGYDNITGFNLGGTATQSDNLEFTGTATVAANAAAQSVVGYTAVELNYTIATGILTFSGTKAATLSVDAAIAAVASSIVTDTATVLFKVNSDSYVFNNNTNGDALVKLVGITTADALVTTNSNGANDLFIS